MKIGLIAGSYKPYHAGHHFTITKAASENDEVHLFVSLSDRKRHGELPILGTDMKKIWIEHLEPIMPANVTITYGGSPVGNLYKELENACKEESNATYTIYSDPEDMERSFSDGQLQKYAKFLWDGGQIIKSALGREETVDISGTKMRSFIASGDKNSFIEMLPPGVDGNEIWKILNKKITSEIMLRKYVRLMLGMNLCFQKFIFWSTLRNFLKFKVIVYVFNVHVKISVLTNYKQTIYDVAKHVARFQRIFN